jgi:uncharacterized protein (DUF3084 family)
MKLLAAAGFLVLSAVSGFGQDKSAFPYVDMAKAQALIDVMTKENETLKADADRLRAEAADLTAKMTGSQKGAADLVPLWNAVKARYGELATLGAEAVDRDLKSRADAATATTKDLLKRLSARMDELGVQAASLGREVETRLAQVSVDEARLQRNTDDIIILQATIARTKAQQGRLETVLADLSTLSAQADAALK